MILNDKSQAKSVKLIKRDTQYTGYHRLDQLNLQYPLFEGGFSGTVQHEVIVRKDVAAVLLFDPQRHQFVFVEQFRTGVYCRSLDDHSRTNTHPTPWTLEIVAGDVEPKETFQSVAKREVLEETGLALTDLMPIYEYWVSPANHSGKMAVFLGRIDSSNAEGVHGLASENEDIRIHTISLETAYRYLEEGKITYAPAIIALQWFKLNETKICKLWDAPITS